MFVIKWEYLDYAYDICHLSHYFFDVDSKLISASETAHSAVLKMIIAKTKQLIPMLNKNSIYTIDNINTFCYLGSIPKKIWRLNGEQICPYQQSPAILRPAETCLELDSISKRTKISLFTSNVNATLLYKCVLWNAAARDIQSFQNFLQQIPKQNSPLTLVQDNNKYLFLERPSTKTYKHRNSKT